MALDFSTRIWTGTNLADELSDNGQNAGATLIHSLGGADTIKGFGDNDILIGGSGDDALTGGNGADLFAFKFVYHPAVPAGQDIIVHHDAVYTTQTLTLGFDGAPGLNADWKAWENYERRLETFFNGAAATPGSYLYLKSAAGGSWTFDDAKIAALKTLFNGWTDDAGTDSGLIYLGQPATGTNSGPKKIANTGGWGDTNHDLDNNLAHGSPTSAAFRTIDNALLTGTKVVQVLVSEAWDEVTPGSPAVPAYFEGVDGHDTITDLSIGVDFVYLGNVAATQQAFQDNFDVVKGSTAVTISNTHGEWSVNVDIQGLNGVTGAAFNALSANGADLEAWVYAHLINQTPTIGSAAWQTYVTTWLA